MKTTGDNRNILLSRKRSATVALQEIKNENCLDQEHSWTSKSPSLVSSSHQLRSSVTEPTVVVSTSLNMNTDANNNSNALKEEEVTNYYLFCKSLVLSLSCGLLSIYNLKSLFSSLGIFFFN